MEIKHVLNDGTVLNDITGHVVKGKDVPDVYEVINQIKKEKEGKHGSQV